MTTNRVTFNEEEHSYTNMYDEKYISATTLIGKYKQPFDTQRVATAYAKKNGHTAAYWIEKWANISKAACDKGTAFHKRKEAAMLGANAIVTPTSVTPVIDINKFTEPNIDYTKLPNGVYPELLLWNHYFKIAGLADIVTIEDGYFDIDDYKTNKEIKTRSFCNFKTGKYTMMKYPIAHLEDCNFIHYSLQLSLYAVMLEEMGLKCRSICFHHHPPGADPTTVQDEGIKYSVKYLKREILSLLIHYTGKPYLKLVK